MASLPTAGGSEGRGKGVLPAGVTQAGHGEKLAPELGQLQESGILTAQ